jgi:hypothetical protein
MTEHNSSFLELRSYLVKIDIQFCLNLVNYVIRVIKLVVNPALGFRYLNLLSWG